MKEGQSNKRSVLSRKSWPFFTLLVFCLFSPALYFYNYEPNTSSDLQCNALLDSGKWDDGRHHVGWQPHECTMRTYSKTDIESCLKNQRVLYVGDSIMREQFYSMDFHYNDEKTKIHFDFWWDPHLNDTRTFDMIEGNIQGQKPALLVIGAGLWYISNGYSGDYFNGWKSGTDKILEAVQRPPDSATKIADAVLLSPVEDVAYELLTKVRQKDIKAEKINKMNDYLRFREKTLQPTVLFGIPYAWNRMTHSSHSLTKDGLHFRRPLTATEAMLAINFRCNHVLPQDRVEPDLCCVSKPVLRDTELTVIPMALATVCILWVMKRALDMSRDSTTRTCLPSARTCGAIAMMGLSVLYMFVADRTALFSKIDKHFDPFRYDTIRFVLAILGVTTLTWTNGKDTDAGFLNRDQTDEWKGWMQLGILVYHYMGSSSPPDVYNTMRVLVAAYLFQTGYGHFCFYYRKQEFTLQRVTSVLVRLNLLTFILTYVMDNTYLSYYFTPLVSFWYLVVTLTMYIGRSYNQTKPWFLLLKIVVMAFLTAALIHVPGVLEAVFRSMAFLFNVHWEVKGWRFRMALDAFIVYIGMLVAFLTIWCQDFKVHQRPVLWRITKGVAIGASVGALLSYFWFCLTHSTRDTYTQWHPFTSWIPIIAFIVLRNATLWLRNNTSRFFILVGQCSLETFIAQYHIWLANDTEQLLVLVPSPWEKGAGWWLNLTIVSIIFFIACFGLRRATEILTKTLCASRQTSLTAQGYQTVPLTPLTNASTTDVDDLDNNSDNNNNNTNNNGDGHCLLGGANNGQVDCEAQAPFWQRNVSQGRPCFRRLSNLPSILTDQRVHIFFFLVCVGIINRLY